MNNREDVIERKMQTLLEDNTEQAIEINNLKHELDEKDFELRTLDRRMKEEVEMNIVIRDCILRFTNESSISGLVKVCAEYLFHYYRPDLTTFYIGEGTIYEQDINTNYSHVYEFKTEEKYSTTTPTKLGDLFEQMVKSRQTVKQLSSFDLVKLDEGQTHEAVVSKIQYSNKVIGFVLMEYVDGTLNKNTNLLNLLLEVFANNYSMLLVTGYIAQKYDNALTEACIDYKTGVFNTRQFNIDIAQMEENDFCLVAMDIDNFKNVNDSYGHDSGDDVLKHVGQVLDRYMLKLGGRGYREGGDEFLGISRMPLTETETEVKAMLEELSKYNYTDTAGTEFSVTNSAGLYQRNGGENLVDVKKKVDILLYESKQRGKKNCTVDQLVMIP